VGRGARSTHAIHVTTYNPSYCHVSAELWSPSYVLGASTPTCDIPSLYVWTPWRRGCGCCYADRLWQCGGCCRDDHEEETIMIDYFLYTDAWLRWIVTPTLLPLVSASSGKTIYDPFTCKFPGRNDRCSAGVACPFPYIFLVQHPEEFSKLASIILLLNFWCGAATVLFIYVKLQQCKWHLLVE
jgi:hypothetical protein